MSLKNIKHYLITGFIMLLPVFLTFWVLSLLLSMLTNPFLGITQRILALLHLQIGPIFIFTEEQVVTFISQVLSITFLVLLIVIVGAIGRYFVFRSFLHLGDALIKKIPVISSVYKTSRELLTTLFSPENRAFKQVVLVPFPNSPTLALGFMTRSTPVLGGKIAVFIPTTPNPTTGFLLFFDEKDVSKIDMKVDEALRFIVSCGVLLDTNSPINAKSEKV